MSTEVLAMLGIEIPYAYIRSSPAVHMDSHIFCEEGVEVTWRYIHDSSNWRIFFSSNA